MQKQSESTGISCRVEKAKMMMAEKGYSERTIENYEYIWRSLIEYAGAKEEILCVDDLIASFARDRYRVADILHPKTDREKDYARKLLCLQEITTGTWITHRSYRQPEQFKSTDFKEAYDCYSNRLAEKKLKQRSISLKRQILRDFLLFAENEGSNDIKELDLTIVSHYLTAKKNLSTPAKSNIIITLRDFFRTPEISAQLTRDLSINLKVYHDGRYERLPSTYSKDEIRSILSCIDRTQPEGKKDYAVILMAVDTGMRMSDIINLKLTDIKWSTESIEFFQIKTGEFVSASISNALKLALLDYLMYARPKNTAVKNLFLRSLAPYTSYISAGHYYKRLNKYFKAAGVKTDGKHHGMHTLRHSLAARLMADNVPITIISESLGHKYANVTKQYIRIDTDKLRLAALEVTFDE